MLTESLTMFRCFDVCLQGLGLLRPIFSRNCAGMVKCHMVKSFAKFCNGPGTVCRVAQSTSIVDNIWDHERRTETKHIFQEPPSTPLKY